MKIDRRVVDRKRQLLVPIPPEARDHLGLVGGARVWWHVGTKGRLTLTTTGRTRGGRPRLDTDCLTCDKYRAELERLRTSQATTEGLPPVQLFWAGFMLAVKRYGDVPDRLDGQREVLRDLRVMVRELVKRSSGARPDPSAQVHEEGAAPARPIPDPPPPPCRVCGEPWAAHPKPDHAWDTPPVGTEQGADSSGRQPQESHSET